MKHKYDWRAPGQISRNVVRALYDQAFDRRLSAFAKRKHSSCATKADRHAQHDTGET